MFNCINKMIASGDIAQFNECSFILRFFTSIIFCFVDGHCVLDGHCVYVKTIINRIIIFMTLHCTFSPLRYVVEEELWNIFSLILICYLMLSKNIMCEIVMMINMTSKL